MVWLIQNCRSNKCLIPQTPRASGGFDPLCPLPGLYPGPTGDLKTPRLLTSPLTTNPGSAPVSNHSAFIKTRETELFRKQEVEGKIYKDCINKFCCHNRTPSSTITHFTKKYVSL